MLLWLVCHLRGISAFLPNRTLLPHDHAAFPPLFLLWYCICTQEIQLSMCPNSQIVLYVFIKRFFYSIMLINCFLEMRLSKIYLTQKIRTPILETMIVQSKYFWYAMRIATSKICNNHNEFQHKHNFTKNQLMAHLIVTTTSNV